jgi:hypothetical protein
MSPGQEKWRTVRCGKQGGAVQVRTQEMSRRQKRRSEATTQRRLEKKRRRKSQ